MWAHPNCSHGHLDFGFGTVDVLWHGDCHDTGVITPPRHDVVELKRERADGGFAYGSLTGGDQHCFNAFLRGSGDDAGDAEELIVEFRAAQIFQANTGVMTLWHLCDDNASFFNDSDCKEAPALLRHVQLPLRGAAPFFDGAVVIWRSVFTRDPPSATAATSTTTAGAVATELTSISAPAAVSSGVAIAIISLAGVTAVCLAVLTVFCFMWRPVASRRGGGSSASVGTALGATRPVNTRPQQSEIDLHGFAKRNHLLIASSAISCDAGADGTAAVVHGLFHGVTEVAIKRVRVTAPAAEAAILNEVQAWRRARHPNIVLLQGVVVGGSGQGPGTGCLVLEWVRGCNLGAYVQSRRSSGAFGVQVSSSQQATGVLMIVDEHRLLVDVARALHHLHSLQPAILHLGLQPSTALVETALRPPRAKVSDFSLSRTQGGVESSQGFSPPEDDGWRACAAPELLQDGSTGVAVDVYSFGRVALFTITGELAARLPNLQDNHWGWSFLGSLAGALPVAISCVAHEPEERPKFQEVYEGLSGPMLAPQVKQMTPERTDTSADHSTSRMSSFLVRCMQRLEAAGVSSQV